MYNCICIHLPVDSMHYSSNYNVTSHDINFVALEFSSSQPAAFDFVNKRAVIGGMIDLNILQGDLTSQKTDAVVNCTNKELNLRLGT